jgi:nucleotide-binding universal stress UspA family protein
VGVAADGSSDRAVAFAARQARLASTSVRFVHAWTVPAPIMSGATALALEPDRELADHQVVLDDAMHAFEVAHPSLELHGELVRDDRADALLGFAKESSMLVMGTHHHSPLTGALLGSVARDVLWRAECPVCVVPNAAADHRSVESDDRRDLRPPSSPLDDRA